MYQSFRSGLLFSVVLAACGAWGCSSPAKSAADAPDSAAGSGEGMTSSAPEQADQQASAEAKSGEACGGMTGVACAAGMFCLYAEDAHCGAADQMGSCTPLPEVCTMDYRPVCGCDDKTYSNACGAHAKGVSVASQGECAEQ